MKKVNIGILGYGTVGSAVEKLIKKNGAIISARTGLELKVVKVCDPSPRVRHPLLTRDPYKLINDLEISVIVEAIGGVHPALELILAAIKKGKHVVTSNKEVIALHYDKIFSAAAKHKVSVRFEAAVCGGIPIIGPLSSDLLSNDINEIYGIVNGTTNYILSRMTKNGTPFSEALLSAKEKGYAEANPKKDIDGFDASYKAAILAMVAFRAKVRWEQVHFEGIANITQEDIQYANESGYAIKLLAVAKKSGNACSVRVHPTLIPKDHPLASVSGPMNAVYVKGNAVGELMFYGQGAGGLPTASAVISDVLRAANPNVKIQSPKLEKINMRSIDDISSRYYVRLTAPDKHGVLARISKAFADNKVSIAAVLQKETVGNTAVIVIIIHKAKEKDLRRALAKIKKLAVVRKICSVIRVGL